MESTAAAGSTGALPGAGTDVDTAGFDALAGRANAMYLQIMEANIAFEEKTAGNKAAKAKSGQISG